MSSKADADVAIQPFDEEWLSRLVAVYQMVWGQARAYSERFTGDEVRTAIRRLPDRWLAVFESELVGFVAGTPLAENHDERLKDLIAASLLPAMIDDIYFINELGVTPGFQKKGCGKRLLSQIITSATRRGFKHFVLQTTSHACNEAIRLYKNYGFEPLLDKRGIPIVRIKKQARMDGRPNEDIRVLMLKTVPEDHEDEEARRGVLSDFARAVRRGLLKDKRKTLPCKFIYDEHGSQLFEEICTLPEYYPTRCELEVISQRSDEIASLCGPRVAVVELGSGSSTKTRQILNSLGKNHSDLAYFPIDISSAALQSAVKALRREYPKLAVTPLEGEYEAGVKRVNGKDFDTVLVLWLGTSVGNVEPHEAEKFLCMVHEAFRANGIVILGVDLKKSRAMLEHAYNDALGITARFNLNLLARINRELGGHFDLEAFEHQAIYDEQAGRIEMYLVSRRAQDVSIDQLRVSVEFAEGEMIHTENSYKFFKEEIAQLAFRSGFHLDYHWRDSGGLFSVNALRSVL
jgi:dimethylhistidine N-methyltransferase